jgi:hypothetical protein
LLASFKVAYRTVKCEEKIHPSAENLVLSAVINIVDRIFTELFAK